jgi:hypothetical protein
MRSQGQSKKSKKVCSGQVAGFHLVSCQRQSKPAKGSVELAYNRSNILFVSHGLLGIAIKEQISAPFIPGLTRLVHWFSDFTKSEGPAITRRLALTGFGRKSTEGFEFQLSSLHIA